MHDYKTKKNWVKRCENIESRSLSAFQSFLFLHGWKFRGDSTEREDIVKHIDCRIESPEGKKLSVDVKGLKREISTGRVLVELQNVKGNRGWLFGHADIIAFQVNDNDFLFVPRNALFQLVKKLCNMSVFTKGGFNVVMTGARISDIANCNAPNWYHRPDRPDEKVTFVALEEIRKISLTIN